MLSKTGELDGHLYLLKDGTDLLGYAITKLNEKVLAVVNLLLQPGIDAAVAVSALIKEHDFSYVRVRVEDPSVVHGLVQAGFPTPLPEYGSFMIKALHTDDTVLDAARLLEIGTDRFMISVLDTT
jgi:hypothetical protein